MKIVLLGLFLSTCCSTASAAHPDTKTAGAVAAKFGWRHVEVAKRVSQPADNLIPIEFYGAKLSGASCGLLVFSPDANDPDYIELTGPDEEDGNWPACMGIFSMTKFRLQGRVYVGVGYLQRDTREDFYRHFLYLYQNQNGGFTVDPSLDAVVEDSSEKWLTSKTLELARTKFYINSYPQWTLNRKHMISRSLSSFATLTHKTVPRCYFVTEAGSAPTITEHQRFAPGTECYDVLAATQVTAEGRQYYIAVFKLAGGIGIAVTSVNAHGQITVEETLAARLRSEANIQNVTDAREALLRTLRRDHKRNP